MIISDQGSVREHRYLGLLFRLFQKLILVLFFSKLTIIFFVIFLSFSAIVVTLMIFNVEKCKVMHIGRENPRFEYEMTDKQGSTKVLKSVEIEKDLGVYVQENLKFDKHISLTINRANKLVGLIKRTFSYLDQETLLTLYKTIIRPIIDYGNIIWFPVLKKDIRAVENVQRRLTRLLPELSHLSYEE